MQHKSEKANDVQWVCGGFNVWRFSKQMYGALSCEGEARKPNSLHVTAVRPCGNW